MLSAIVKREYSQLVQNNTARQAVRSQVGSWSDVMRSFESFRRGDSVGGRHDAVFRLLQLLQPLGAGSRLSQSDVDTAGSYLQADPDNLTSRLAFAAIDLAVRNSQTGKTGSALGRYEAVQRVIEGVRPAEVATLYNDDLTRIAHKAIKPHVSRPDVALSLAESGRMGVPNPGHYGAFAPIQKRLTNLASALRAAGHDAQADRCQRWVVQWLMGVIDSEPDASTRLLCADVCARTVRGHESVADDLRRMRDDYHKQSQAAPLDYADQSHFPQPCIAPAEYRSAFRWMALSWSLMLSAVGGFIVFVLSCIGAIGVRAMNRGKPHSSAEKRRPFLLVVIGALIPSMATGGLALIHVFDAGIPSMDWGVAAAAIVGATGALAAIALAAGAVISTVDNRRCRRVTALLAIATGLALLLPPLWITKSCRFLDSWIGAPLVIGVLVAVLLVVAARFSPARARTVAASAAAFWCVNVSATFLVLQIHRAADRRYQAAAINGRADEIGARLGPDWQDVYLASTRRMLRDELK